MMQDTKPTLVLMAGGYGKRLGELTKNCPKPLMEINGRPIIHHILEQYAHQGIRDAVITLHYLGDMIREYLDGVTDLPMKITYVEEEESLGTAGGLALVMDHVSDRMIVSNSDLIVDVDVEALCKAHDETGVDITVCVTEHAYALPYGEVIVDDVGEIRKILEKPEKKWTISTGVYMLNKELVEQVVPRGSYYDMPQLISSVIESKHRRAGSFLIRGRWIDIGTPEDLRRAQEVMAADRSADDSAA